MIRSMWQKYAFFHRALRGRRNAGHAVPGVHGLNERRDLKSRGEVNLTIPHFAYQRSLVSLTRSRHATTHAACTHKHRDPSGFPVCHSHMTSSSSLGFRWTSTHGDKSSSEIEPLPSDYYNIGIVGASNKALSILSRIIIQ